MTKENKVYIILALLFLFIALVGLAVWSVWELVSTYVSPVATRAWALIATVMLLPAFALGKSLGQVEGRGQLKGIDQGVSAVMKAADATLGMRTAAAERIPWRFRRYGIQPEPVMLPPVVASPVIEIREQSESTKIIDL